VGYFTSNGLALIARGIAYLLQNDGTMKLVASPALDESDVSALRLGTENPENILRKVTARTFVEIRDLVARERLNALAWLIAKGSLQVKLAIKTDSQGLPTHGIYHEKLGIFSDTYGNAVAFTGSSNETSGGLVDNFESIDAYWSWNDPQDRVRRKSDNFEALWANKTSMLRLYEFTECSNELLARFKQTHPPRIQEETVPYRASTESKKIRDYQKLALEKWKESGGKGILAMATGTGKTLTALYLIQRMSEAVKPLVVIIVVPYINLSNQWGEELEEMGFRPIKCSESRASWETLVQQGVSALQLGAKSLLILLATNRTFQSEEFQKCLASDKVEHLLIADEVHNMGADQIQKALPPGIRYRLGLSATPERFRDPDGTKAIFDYFGGVVFEFPLKEAIQRKYLCPYFYYPVLVSLDESEATEYLELTKKIGQRWPRDSDTPISDQLNALLIKRARLLGSAAEKVPLLESVVKSIQPGVSKAIVFCGDGQVQTEDDEELIRQVDAACRALGDGCHLRVRRFTCRETSEEREGILNALREGNLDALVAIRCLDEGIDVPDVRQAFILASSTNPRQFIQRRGRLLRNSPGKDFSHIWDFIVIPPEMGGKFEDQAFNVERRLFQKELTRVVEFCETAVNGASALKTLLDLRKRYNLLNL
jgi:DNA phosphorothioation system restriction enzyme